MVYENIIIDVIEGSEDEIDQLIKNCKDYWRGLEFELLTEHTSPHHVRLYEMREEIPPPWYEKKAVLVFGK